MVDSGKVVKGLECCVRSDSEAECPTECPYYRKRWEDDYPDGKLALSLHNDALDLLKQEEEVPVKRCRVHPNARYPFSCGNCGSYLMTTWIACPMCGRKVKWK